MIQIDMEMPNSCYDCPFKKNYRNNDFGIHCECELDDDYRTINILEHSKPQWCPLKEVPDKSVLEDIKDEIENQLFVGRILNSKDFDDGLKWCLDIIDKYMG